MTGLVVHAVVDGRVVFATNNMPTTATEVQLAKLIPVIAASESGTASIDGNDLDESDIATLRGRIRSAR